VPHIGHLDNILKSGPFMLATSVSQHNAYKKPHTFSNEGPKHKGQKSKNHVLRKIREDFFDLHVCCLSIDGWNQYG
jgi:hypothetical protein